MNVGGHHMLCFWPVSLGYMNVLCAMFNGFDFCWLCPLNILCSMVSFLPCLFNSSALPCPPPPATAAATEAQRKLCFPFLSRLLGAGFGPTCIARAGRWMARTRRERWEAGWAGSGSQDLGSVPALVVTPQTPQGWIPMDLSCLLTQENHSLQSPAGEDGVVITLVVCHDCFFCPWVSLVPPTGYWIEFSRDSGFLFRYRHYWNIILHCSALQKSWLWSWAIAPASLDPSTFI